MIKKITLITAFLFIGLVITDTLNNQALTYSSGPPAGHTGSPGDGTTCTSCHGGITFPPIPGAITSNIPGGGYIPGTTYTITATAVHNTANMFGFQISPQNSSGTALGTLVATNTTETQLTGAGAYIIHTSGGTAGTSNSKTWTFDWIAPSAGTGAVTFYGAFNAANNSGDNTGDEIFTSSLAVQEDITISIADATIAEENIHIFPNPVSNELTISFPGDFLSEQSSLEIISMDGRKVKEMEMIMGNIPLIDVSDLKAGMYFVTVKTGNNSYTKKIVKK